MSEQYAHTLIPMKDGFKPSAAQVQTFLTGMRELGAAGGELKTVLRTPSGRVRQVRNPFTQELVTVRLKDHLEIKDLSEISRAIAQRDEYEIELSGAGRPLTPPLPIDFTDPYHVGITCRLSSVLCSTSDLHEQAGHQDNRPAFGKPFTSGSKLGLFTNPHTGERIEVPNAGCAYFWIKFELGKFLFPDFAQADLKFLNPDIVSEARGAFGVSFVQGCCWA